MATPLATSRVRRSLEDWLSTTIAVVTLIVCGALLLRGGFLLGTMNGDIPWPATPLEESVYYWGRSMSHAAVAVALLGSLVAAFALKRVPALRRVQFAVLTFVGAAALGGLVFSAAYGMGTQHLL